MKHLKLTFVGLLALTAAASDAFAFGPPGPAAGRPADGWPPMGGLPPMGGGLPELPVARRPAGSQWPVAYRVSGRWPPGVPRHGPGGQSRGMSRQALQEMPPGISRQAPREMPPGMSRQAP